MQRFIDLFKQASASASVSNQAVAKQAAIDLESIIRSSVKLNSIDFGALRVAIMDLRKKKVQDEDTEFVKVAKEMLDIVTRQQRDDTRQGRLGIQDMNDSVHVNVLVIVLRTQLNCPWTPPTVPGAAVPVGGPPVTAPPAVSGPVGGPPVTAPPAVSGPVGGPVGGPAGAASGSPPPPPGAAPVALSGAASSTTLSATQLQLRQTLEDIVKQLQSIAGLMSTP
jgi:hypothetical protein